MSGPKYDSYVLSAEQRRRLEEQRRKEIEARERELRRQEELRREQQRQNTEKNIRTGLVRTMKATLEELRQVRADMENIRSHSGSEIADIDTIDRMISQTETRLREVEKAGLAPSEEMKRMNASLREDAGQLTALLERSRQSSDAERRTYHQSLDAGIAEALQLFYALPELVVMQPENEFLQRMREKLLSLDETELSPTLVGRMAFLREKAASIQNADYLENFYNIVFKPFMEDCEAYTELQSAWEFNTQRYQALCGEAGESPESLPCTAEGVQALAQHCQALEETIRKNREQEYIRTALDDAMEEMGYALVGDRVAQKKDGRRVRHQLYQLNAGTAVDVTVTNDGKITMELGAPDTEDRTPNSVETRMLVTEMHSFCADHAEIEKRLREKGVLTTEICYYPPTDEYAQIINVSEYQMNAALKKTKETGETRRTATEKRMEMTNE